MNLTLALLAVTAAIPVSLQPHSVKFYSFLVVAARPQPCRGGWRGESPALGKLGAREAKRGTASRWDVPGSCQVPPWAPLGSNVLCVGWHGPVRGVAWSCLWGLGQSQLSPCAGADLGQLCLRATGWWWGDAIRQPAWGTRLGSRQSRRRRSPAGCERGPMTRPGAPPTLLLNENQLYICFISAQRCSGPQGGRRTRIASSATESHHYLAHPHRPHVCPGRGDVAPSQAGKQGTDVLQLGPASS